MTPGIARSLLLNRLKEDTTLPMITGDNQNQKKENRNLFTRFGFEPIETLVRSMGSYPIQQLGGLCRISLFAPRGSGVDALYANADKVLAKFPPNTFITVGDDTVHILASWTESLIQDEDAGWTFMPVFVRWLAFEQATA